MRKIKKGDNVVVIAGRDKGKRGDVTHVVDAEHVVVAGINQVKKHTRPNPMKNEPGGIVTKDMPIHVSNVAIWNPGHAEGGPHRLPHARGRPQGPLLQVERRSDRSLTMARLKEIYNKEVVPALMKQFGYKSTMQVPRISKIVLNMGVGEAIADKKILENAVGDMQKISGQKPVITKAKKSIAVWKIRTGYPIGCMVTLRQERMYEFLDRLVSIALPRVRDFRGVSGRSFDGRGNFNMGVKEQIIFPEIEYDKIDSLRGMNITIATTAKTDAEAKALLAAFKFPFKNWVEDAMAKTAVINRDLKRRVAVKKYAKKRAELQSAIDNTKLSDEDRMAARHKLQQLPRDASPTRLRNRCKLTGRPRGVFSKFGLGRNKLREIAMRGEIPGVVKASW